MNIIYNENKNIIVKSEAADLVLTSLDLFNFKFADFTAGESTAALLLSDGFNEDVIVKFSESKDSDGNTFASIDELKSYLSGLCKKSPNLGTNIRLDNIELSNTGSHLKMVNLNTNEQSFMVQHGHPEGNPSGSTWGERTPPTNKLSSGIDVLSVETWITKMELAA